MHVPGKVSFRAPDGRATGFPITASKAEVQSLLKTSVYSQVPWVNDFLSRIKLVHSIDLMLERANVDMTPGLFLLCSVGAAGVTFFLASMLAQPALIALIFALIAM